ncbi:hypothetical protein [Nostoc sp. UHCC 0252]|uniref:hypothetical protein n=1 Tax=Nostoc sp. UHCC 0252 TaxID=3110241 RepID=UPI002B20CAB4|nr:hypothetical protein [Nostoc sp. UHCC 0252]MEA5605581.1 hypothetical protein [Nostoc sp. UHCC 0252]
MNKFVKWFNTVTFIGVLINIFGMALPFIFTPQWYLDFLNLPGGGGSVTWMRHDGLLLFFISILYIPGGRDPIRYSWNAKFAVLVRMAIGSYWLWLVFIEGQTRSFLIFGIFDCVYAIFNGILLWLTLKNTETVEQLA